jgi:hypothetical protein
MKNHLGWFSSFKDSWNNGFWFIYFALFFASGMLIFLLYYTKPERYDIARTADIHWYLSNGNAFYTILPFVLFLLSLLCIILAPRSKD